MLSLDELNERFGHHDVVSDADKENMNMLRSVALSIASFINDVVPDSREKALALTHLEEVVFWANAAIARHQQETNQ